MIAFVEKHRFISCFFDHFRSLKGLGHAILGNFSTDQMVIELKRNMKITVQDYRRTQTKHSKAKKGQGWAKLERIELDCIWLNWKNIGPPFFKFMSVYINISQGSYGSWKVLEFYYGIFQDWKVLEKGHWSWEVLEIH